MTFEEFVPTIPEHYITAKSALDHSLILVYPITFSRARLSISYPGPWMYETNDDVW